MKKKDKKLSIIVRKFMDNKYKYSYIEDGTYCYPHTDILKNKLGIKDDDFLFEIERKLVSLRVDELMVTPIKGDFDFSLKINSLHPAN